MHASELVDLAALIALNSRSLVQESERLVDDALQSYWSGSRCRLDRWGRGLRAGAEDAPFASSSTFASSSGKWRLLEEIFVSEILARLTAGLFVAHDRFHQREEAAPVGRNVLYGHIDARRRALQWAKDNSGSADWSTDDVQKLFSQSARWNDLLLGHLLVHSQVEEFAFDADRAREFSYDVDQLAVDPATDDVTATFLRSSLRMALSSSRTAEPYSAELNAQIAAAIIGCFGPGLFDSFGLLKSTWQYRMESVTDETISMVDRLVEDELSHDRWRK